MQILWTPLMDNVYIGLCLKVIHKNFSFLQDLKNIITRKSNKNWLFISLKLIKTLIIDQERKETVSNKIEIRKPSQNISFSFNYWRNETFIFQIWSKKAHCTPQRNSVKFYCHFPSSRWFFETGNWLKFKKHILIKSTKSLTTLNCAIINYNKIITLNLN